MNLDDPIATVLRLARLLDRAEIPYALYGGLAVAAYGVARETKDADLAVASADTRKVAIAAQVDRLARELEDHDVQERWQRCHRS